VIGSYTNLSTIWINKGNNITIINNSMSISGIIVWKGNNVTIINNSINIGNNRFQGISFLDANNSLILYNNVSSYNDETISVKNNHFMSYESDYIIGNNITCKSSYCLTLRTNQYTYLYSDIVNNIINGIGGISDSIIRVFNANMNFSFNNVTTNGEFGYIEGDNHYHIARQPIFSDDNILTYGSGPYTASFYFEGANNDVVFTNMNITSINAEITFEFSNGGKDNTMSNSIIYGALSFGDSIYPNVFNNVLNHVTVIGGNHTAVTFNNNMNGNYIKNSNLTSNVFVVRASCNAGFVMRYVCPFTYNYLINDTFNKSSINITNQNSTIYVQNYFDATVLDNNTGNPISGATLEITDQNNLQTLITTTGSDGKIPEQTLTDFLANSTFNSTSGYYQ
jgi:hypothetical protein